MEGQRVRGEARGRLDMFGGMAAEAGALVLTKPTRATTRVEIAGRDGNGIQTFSCQSERDRTPFSVQSTTLRALISLPEAQWRAKLESLSVPRWMLPVWGSFGVFACHTGWWPTGGLHIRVASDVPRARGVASSSALCIATLRALEQWSGQTFSETEKARWVLEVEQDVVGVPCNVSEPLSCAFAESGAIVPILCRPDRVRESFALPEDTILVGCPVGATQQNTETPGTIARIAARMGKFFLQEKLGARDYPSDYVPSQLGNELPVTLRGSEFQTRVGAGDSVEGLEAGRSYPVRAATRFGIEENFRALLTQSLLRSQNALQSLPFVGELMYQSHTGLGAMGLTTPACNALVEALRTRGMANGFYGARVTGEGAARTVVVLLQNSARHDLEKLRVNFSPAGPLVE